jgi:hypothetical protein
MSLSTPKAYVPFSLGIVAFAVYLSTLAPVVYLGDSGELTAGAFSLGIPHASGFPIYSLLGKIFCMIPLGNIGFRMNLMSAVFSAVTVGLVYAIIFKMTSSALSSAVAALYLAFMPLFWSQTVFAEVYPLHTFFVALMIRLLWWWDENKEFPCLLLFVFITGLSFGNHMQTVMLAPPVLYLIISGDKRALLNVRNFITISLVFSLSLSLYIYLPIRTEAGAAIHWGDPNTIERFFAHVTTKSYRESIVFGATPSEYLSRMGEALGVVITQYGILLILALWGWLKVPLARWRMFFTAVVFFDLLYTVFLNVVSFEITPFTLPTSIVLAILMGVGLGDVLRVIRQHPGIGSNLKKTAKMACCTIPVISLTSNYDLCNQSYNYTAYEHVVNIFRTADYGSTIFLDGDNNIFPAVYGRIAEGMGESVILFDSPNIFFKWHKGKYRFDFEGTRDGLKSMAHEKIVKQGEKGCVYFGVFNPYAVSIPTGFHLIPYGTLRKLVSDKDPGETDDVANIWEYYSTESFYDDFVRDYMAREVCSFYFFREGENLLFEGKVAEGLKQLKTASKIGYNDTTLHSDIAVLLMDRGFFNEARKELEKALIYHDDLSGIYNNWGYYYDKSGDYSKAIASFNKAIELGPRNYTYHNNLGLVFHGAGNKKEARESFKNSLLINGNQPKLKEFMETHGLQ